jgi:DNA repair protein RadC
MHYRNGREAQNGDKVVQLETSSGKIVATGQLQNAVAGNNHCNGELVITGRDGRKFSRGPVGDSAGGKGVSPNLLQRVGLSRAILSQFVDRSVVGTMTVPDRPMDNADDVAALAYEYLRKQPQENFMAVILDGQGRPIQILRHTLGGISSTNFIPHVIAGVAASTRGARTVYMVHNHPSTTTRFSSADMLAAQSLSKTIEAIGMRFGGSLVVTDGDAQEGNMTPKYIFHPGGELVEHTPAAMSDNSEGDKQTDARAVHPVVVFDDRPGSETNAEIQVVERNFEVRKDALFPRIKDGKDAVEQIPPLLATKPGIALIDKAGRLVGVIQMSIGEMRNVSSAGSMIYPEQGQGRGYISNEDERANPNQDNRVYKRTQFSKDTQPGAWNNPLAMLMAALERSNAESVIISIGSEEFGASNKDTRSDAVRNIQKAIQRVGGNKVEVLDVINNNKSFPSQVLSSAMYGNYPSPYASAEQQKGGLLKTGRRLGFNEEGAPYGEQGQGNDAPIEREAPQSLGDVVSQGMEGETGTKEPVEEGAGYGVAETNPEDPNAGAEFARQEREAGARVNPPSGLDNAQPAEPVIKKTRKPRAPKAAGVNVSAFPRLDATPGSFGRLSGDQMKQFGLSDAMLDQFVEHSTYGQIASGVQSVKTPDDAAHVLAGMRKRPQEQIVLLITDKTGKPLQVATHSLGGPASAGFNPGIIIGTAASTPGAANVWFVHNHPSGKSSLSPADISAGGSVENLCKAAGLRYMATMAIAGSKYAVMDNDGSISANIPTPAHARKYTIPLTERMFSYRVSQNSIAYSDPLVVGQELRKIFGDTQPGIVLADNSNRAVAAIPLDGDVMQAMRAILPGNNPTKQTGFAKYAAGVDRAGGVNMFIYTADLPMPLAVKIIENMSKVANATKVTALDAMNSSEVSLSRHIIGYSTDFKEPASGYNRDQGEAQAPGSLQDVVEQGLSGDQKKKMKR